MRVRSAGASFAGLLVALAGATAWAQGSTGREPVGEAFVAARPVSVAAGAAARHTVDLASLPGRGGEEEEEAAVPLRVRVEGASGAEELTVLRAGHPPLDVRPVPMAGGVGFEIPCRATPGLAVAAPGKVSLPTAVRDGECGGVVTVRLLAAATLAGRVTGAVGEPEPEAALLPLDCVPAITPVTGAYEVALDEKGRWRAVVPAFCSGFRLQVGSRVPVTWRELDLEPGEARQLGAVQLAPGAALLARVVDGAAVPLEGVVVDAFGEDEIQAAVEATFAGEPAAGLHRSTTGPQGWVRLRGLPEPAVYLRLQRPGRPATFAGPLETAAGAESLFEDLVLPEPASLTVAVAGPLLPGRRFATVEGDASAACGWLRFVRRTVPFAGGRAHFETLPPGEWRLSVVAGPPLGTVLGSRRVSLPPGGVEAVEITAAGALYRGRVESGGEPVRGALSLGSEAGRRARVLSDEDGRFEVFLEESGRYEVDVQGLQPEVLAGVSGVLFEDPDTEVVIRLPSGRIRGVLLDADGEPVPHLPVVATSLGPAAERAGAPERSADPADRDLARRRRASRRTARSGADGSFELPGLAAGRWALRAERDALAADAVVELLENEERTSVTLRLRDDTAGGILELWIAAAGGAPVAGAQVEVWAPAPVALGQPRFLARTVGESGVIELPEALREPGAVNVAVDAPAQPWTAVRTAITHGGGITVAPAGGDLRIVLRADPLTLRQLALVRDDGAFVRLARRPGRVAVQEAGRCAEIRVSHLATGRWRLASTLQPLALRTLIATGEVLAPVAPPVTVEEGAVAEPAVTGGWACEER
ncbi:MAG TPA: hypothetical protein VHQ65_17395 [Thermoanaerobaculia bacterium]|nr:hypothetical protein [Thermoanaerobaculia bacterium]